MRQFFAGLNVAHRHEDDLPLHADIRIARVIAENHAALTLCFRQWANEKIIANLDFCRAERFLNFTQGFAVENVPAFDANDLAFGNRLFGKKASAVNGALFHEGFGRNAGQI